MGMQNAEMRDRQLNIRLSEEEDRRLTAICDHLGINAANLFRMMLKEKARALAVEPVSVPSDPPSSPRVKTSAKSKKR